MFQTQLINQVVEWERRLEIEDEKRKNYRDEPDYFPANPQPCRAERPSIFARIFRPAKNRPSVSREYPQDPCREGQPG